MSLPDSCAELLLADLDTDSDTGANVTERESEEICSSTNSHETWRWPDEQPTLDCCRTLSGGSGTVRCASAASLLHIPIENSRSGTCRRELPSRSVDTTQHRRVTSECMSRGGGGQQGAAGGTGGAARLSAAVPDVAMAPNANTHLLTARDYFRLTPWEYTGGGVLQLDLGDGATHTPRPGSRAARASGSHSARPAREHAQAMSCLRARADDDELRAAISVMRAYSSFGSRGGGSSGSGGSGGSGGSNNAAASNTGAVLWRGGNATLPPSRENKELQLPPAHVHTASRSRSSASPCGSGGATSTGRLPDMAAAAPHITLSRVCSASPVTSPRHLYRHHPTAHQQHDYTVEGSYGSSSGSGSRGHSPNTYA